MKTLETMKNTKGVLLSPLSIAVVQHLTENGPCSLSTITEQFRRTSDEEVTSMSARLRKMRTAGHVHVVRVHGVQYWKAGAQPLHGPDEDEEEEVPAARRAVSPRRINVMAGDYTPPRSFAMRPGADHSQFKSYGVRC